MTKKETSDLGTGPDSGPSPIPEQARVARAEGRREAVRLLDLSTIGLVFPVALLMGYFGGGAAGGWLGRPDLGSWLGLGLGFLAGFYNVFKVVGQLERRERRRDEAAFLDAESERARTRGD